MMGFSTAIGLMFGFTLIMAAVLIGGIDKFWNLVSLPSFVIVIGGSIAAVLAAYPLRQILKLHQFIFVTFSSREFNPLSNIELIVAFADIARTDGVLALEKKIQTLEDSFLARGVQLITDGLSPDVVEHLLHEEMRTIYWRHTRNRGMVAMLGRLLPAFGLIGTLIGLVLMLANLDPATIGSNMAIAVLTTLYGALLANLIFNPLADKLAYMNDEELRLMEITLKGILAIQAGESPRMIRNKLLIYVDPEDRPINDF
ncbi:MAG: MotA/TolQ/ExbB proton channel family protein [Planctomycetaceae bacterium]|jgi:chemotaxis protein MotA|nr:MotA/TolQ/ExbB proton channel family protein [Planctomycetaceae bacterium]